MSKRVDGAVTCFNDARCSGFHPAATTTDTLKFDQVAA